MGWAKIRISYCRKDFRAHRLVILGDDGISHTYQVDKRGTIGYCLRELERQFNRPFHTADSVLIVTEPPRGK